MAVTIDSISSRPMSWFRDQRGAPCVVFKVLNCRYYYNVREESMKSFIRFVCFVCFSPGHFRPSSTFHRKPACRSLRTTKKQTNARNTGSFPTRSLSSQSLIFKKPSLNSLSVFPNLGGIPLISEIHIGWQLACTELRMSAITARSIRTRTWFLY